MLETLHQESFAELPDKCFHVVQPDSAGFDLTLAVVHGHLRTPRQEAFSLIFHGPAQPFMPQGTYRLHNEALGDLDLFLVPIGHGQDGYEYEAVFNRLIRPD
jgi:hypothetical protein